MNRYFGWLQQPAPGWFWVYTFAIGTFMGGWLQAISGAEQRGAVLAWESHVVFASPTVLAMGWLYALRHWLFRREAAS